MNDSTSMFSSAPDSAPTTDISKSINHREDTQSSQLLPRRSTCIKKASRKHGSYGYDDRLQPSWGECAYWECLAKTFIDILNPVYRSSLAIVVIMYLFMASYD